MCQAFIVSGPLSFFLSFFVVILSFSLELEALSLLSLRWRLV